MNDCYYLQLNSILHIPDKDLGTYYLKRKKVPTKLVVNGHRFRNSMIHEAIGKLLLNRSFRIERD